MLRLIGRAFLASLSLGICFSAAYATEPEAVPGEFVVKFKNTINVNNEDVSDLSQILGSYVKSKIPGQNIVVIKRPVFEIRNFAIQALSKNPDVALVEPNFIYRINRTPNDPNFGALWGLQNIGANDTAGIAGTAGMDVGAEKAWDIQTGSKNVLVAVIDTGIMWNNPDLVDNVWTNMAEANGQAGVDDDGNGFIDDIHGYDFANNDGDPMDDHGHGSHCSGTIGAKGNDGKGIVGVNWDVKIMGVKFLDAEGSGSLDNALKSIDYATQMGAKILSNSWGGGGASQTLKEAIERSNKAGSLFVAAAGNESNNNDASPTYPNSYDVPNILSVAAVDNRGRMASFSNYGKKSVHVAAPGVNIVSTTTAGYESWSGTSMATPHVSGIAALVLANEPNLTGLELKNRIISTARRVAGLRNKVSTGGMANAYLALTDTATQPDPTDPVSWPTEAFSLESPHPYESNANHTWQVNVAGALQFSIHFEKFETEANFDVLTIKDAKGNVVDKISGANDDTFSAVIDGDSATLEFTSDDTMNFAGFKISKVAVKH